jgi:formylglycine-generating enzyme required for sulfatase activity
MKKDRLPLILTGVIVGSIALVLAIFEIWTPLKIKYNASNYASADAVERVRIAEVLCKLGDSGRKALYNAFRERCIAEQKFVPGGTFVMGCDNGESDERPAHIITVSGFALDIFEVTNEKYYVFILLTGRSAPEHWLGGRIPEGEESRPVVNVSWHDAKAYSSWLGMSLPTEAQWEYTCRAGSAGDFCFGNNSKLLVEYAWFDANCDNSAHSVAGKKANAWGLFDMHGNVFEWCRDWYDGSFYEKSPPENPRGPDVGYQRVVRGGAWNFKLDYCRSSCRYMYYPITKNASIGFRVCKSSASR